MPMSAILASLRKTYVHTHMNVKTCPNLHVNCIDTGSLAFGLSHFKRIHYRVHKGHVQLLLKMYNKKNDC